MSAVSHVTSSDQFKGILKDNKYVIVDFTATWCGPCKAIAPLFEKFATEFALDGKLAFTKVDVDDNTDIAQEYSVRAMPTFIIFADGVESTEFARVVGSNPSVLAQHASKLGQLVRS